MIHVALFGAGRIGQIHAKNLTRIPGIHFKYICDPVPDLAQQISQQTGAIVASQEEIFADTSISVILIATPATNHHALIKQAAQAKLHIFCEKPVDLTASAAAECAKTVEENGVACMIGFQRRFDPTFNSAKERILQGEIGNPEMLIVTSRDPAPPPLKYLKKSGGIFNDMLIHDFDIVRWILCDDGDEPEWLIADGSCVIDAQLASIPDLGSAVVTIKTHKGKLAQINAQRRASYGYDQRFEVLGSKGMVQCNNHRPFEVVQSDANGIHTDLPEHFFLQRYREAYRLELEHFFSHLQSKKPFRVSIADGVAAQKMAEAATKSWQTGNKVYL